MGSTMYVGATNQVILVFTLITLASSILAQPTAVTPTDDEILQWHNWKKEHLRIYESSEHEELRRTIFLQHLKFVREHNKKYQDGVETFEVELNEFADKTTAEFVASRNGLQIPKNYQRSGNVFQEPSNVVLPKAIDWRKKGAVTPVKDQGQCGSCWAFSATGSLEGQTFIKKKKLISLSEQNLVDCSTDEGNEGCNGGMMDQAFKYIKINNGIDTEASYPYEARDDTCHYNPKTKGATDSGYFDIQANNETKLQVAVAYKGPVSVAIDASHASFQLYKKGVYKERDCSTTELDHGVLVVGYGTDKTGGDFWLVKNSWGKAWGMQGYIMMARNRHNMCGIATMASLPTV